MATDFVGVVTSDKMNKTRRVEIQRLEKHPRYNKYIKRRTICYAHDEENKTKVGDVVSIKQCRPMSKLKRWSIQSVVRQAQAEAAAKKEGAS
jgi:small subunit ribosomal protein S17